MPRDFPRTRRVGEQLQRELAALIRDEINDPRVGMVSVSAVEVSRDLSHAKVFISTLGEPEDALRRRVAVQDGAVAALHDDRCATGGLQQPRKMRAHISASSASVSVACTCRWQM